MVTDPVSDLIIQIKNAGKARKESVLLPYSKLKEAIATVLVSEGYLKSASKKKPQEEQKSDKDQSQSRESGKPEEEKSMSKEEAGMLLEGYRQAEAAQGQLRDKEKKSAGQVLKDW